VSAEESSEAIIDRESRRSAESDRGRTQAGVYPLSFVSVSWSSRGKCQWTWPACGAVATCLSAWLWSWEWAPGLSSATSWSSGWLAMDVQPPA